MGNLSVFLKENKRVKENFRFAPTASICDENGKPVEFEFKHLTSAEDRLIREESVIGGKFNSAKYVRKMLAACVVYPNLFDKELQDSYGVNKPEDLLEQLIDDAAEWTDFSIKIQKELGFISLSEAEELAKN